MKTRESGMPDETMWQGFFDPPSILAKLGLDAKCGNVVEFGCGYGTFTIPAAGIVQGTLFTFDIEAEMVEATRCKAEAAELKNVVVLQKDFAADGTGLAEASADYVMLFNILHAEERIVLLQEAWRVLKAGGKLGIIHWNYDASTPRGPNMEIRPRPEQCRSWAEQVGLELLAPGLIDLPPYHYGFVFGRPLS